IGNIHHFRSARHLASWLGITPKEHSTGSKRRLGRISKQGDTDLRTLLIHGARSALCAALDRQNKGRELSHLQRWAVQRADTMHLGKASVALANKIARILWALWTRERTFWRRLRPAVSVARPGRDRINRRTRGAADLKQCETLI
ncbi:MAG: IS110 family transposase, partial [Gemmatimonadetes bacterium]|nr:IS110 family transposase [Gemmatimonadota bacterium]